MKLLADEVLFDYKESEQKPKNNSVLRCVEGYATYTNKPNRNKRFFRDGFWERILQDDRIDEMVRTKTFFGSSKHPREKESPIPEHDNVSHAIRKYRVDKTGVYVWIDVLNTESGRTLNTLLDYGSKLGLSTRAYGEQEEHDGLFYPIESDYKFVTWDFVVFPAFDTARVSVSDDVKFDVKKLKPYTGKNLKISSMDAKALCDYTGIKYTFDSTNQNTVSKKDFDIAVQANIDLKKRNDSLQKEINGLKNGSKMSFDSFFQKFITTKKTNLCDNVKVEMPKEDLEKTNSLLKVELSTVYKEMEELKSNYRHAMASLVDSNRNLEAKISGRNTQVNTNTYEDKYIGLKHEHEVLIKTHEEAIDLLDSMQADFESVVAENKKLKAVVELSKGKAKTFDNANVSGRPMFPSGEAEAFGFT